jgi:hypothetical protein
VKTHVQNKLVLIRSVKRTRVSENFARIVVLFKFRANISKPETVGMEKNAHTHTFKKKKRSPGKNQNRPLQNTRVILIAAGHMMHLICAGKLVILISLSTT